VCGDTDNKTVAVIDDKGKTTMSLDVTLKEALRCPACHHRFFAGNDVIYWANITHNLGEMANNAGLYAILWRPEEEGVEFAGELIKPLSKGLDKLKSKPDFFKQFNPANGWGDYEALVKFVSSYLDACRNNPDAIVFVSR